jgi:peptidoglycan-N-acetylglucosamine deacetylase
MIINPPPWPNGAKCAVAFSFDVDADSVVHNTKRNMIANHQHEIAQMRYDPFVALPRLADLFGSREIPVTWFVPGWVIDAYEPQLEVLLKFKHEIAHHGYFHESPNKQSFEQEKDTLYSGIERITSFKGSKPIGYRAPYYGISKNTYNLLIEAGIKYDSSLFADDVPIIVDNGSGSIIELPVPATIDDYNQYVSSKSFDYLMKVSSPQAALEVYKAEFDAMWEFGGLWVGVWHPAVSGRPAQSLAIKNLIDHMLNKGKVWFATHEEIADYVEYLMKTEKWKPRTENIPFYKKPVLED